MSRSTISTFRCPGAGTWRRIPAPPTYTERIGQRYGELEGIEDYCRKAQMVNLESAKAMDVTNTDTLSFRLFVRFGEGCSELITATKSVAPLKRRISPARWLIAALCLLLPLGSWLAIRSNRMATAKNAPSSSATVA